VKATILFNSKDFKKGKEKKTNKNKYSYVEITSPRNELFTLFGQGLEGLKDNEVVKLQVCCAEDPDAIENIVNKDEFYSDIVMFGSPVVLDVNNTLVNLDISGKFRLAIPTPQKNKHLVIGFY